MCGTGSDTALQAAGDCSLGSGRYPAHIDFLFEILLQLLLELIGELLIGLGWESLRAERPSPKPPDEILGMFGCLIAGSVLGAFSGVVLPWRLSRNDGISLLGVFLNAFVFGTLMSVYGSRRERAGKHRTSLSTFWGGTAFAFGVAGARLAVIVAMA